MLCPRCEGLHLRPHSPALPATQVYYVLHRTQESHVRSVRERCHLCTLIASKLDTSASTNHVCQALEAYIVLACTSTCNSGRLRTISVHSRRGFHRLDVLDLPTQASPGERDASYQLQCPECTVDGTETGGSPGASEGDRRHKRRKISHNGPGNRVERHQSCHDDSSSGSPCNLAMAKGWLSECQAHHTICGQVEISSDAYLPTRLIRIDHDDALALVETDSDTKGPYAALSYAWGSGKRVMTLMSVVDAWRQRLPVEIFPQTFLDSIAAAKALGFRYIWIDAFCIIQDDIEDLHRQLPKMGDIYRYAQLTIDVAGAQSSHSGAFVMRDALAYRPCDVPITITAENKTVTKTLTMTTTRVGTDYLDSRGWVLQERILSNRRLVFGKEMAWKCSTHHARESDPWLREHGDLEKRTIFSPAMMRASLHIDDSTSLGFASALGPYRAWYSMVESYSDKLLTFSSDNLKAISGLAFLFQQKYRAPYLAGLWEESGLGRALAWYVGLNDKRPVTNASEGPSWSWSSVGKVRIRFRSWSGETWEPVPGEGASILSTEAHGDNALTAYHSFTSWPIRVRTRVKKALVYSTPSYTRFRNEASFGRSLDSSTIDINSKLLDKREHGRFPALLLDPGTNKHIAEAVLDRAWTHSPPGSDDVPGIGQHSEVCCALLHVEQLEGKYHGSMMVLGKGSTNGVFRRLGIAFLSTENIGWMIPLGNENNEEKDDTSLITIK